MVGLDITGMLRATQRLRLVSQRYILRTVGDEAARVASQQGVGTVLKYKAEVVLVDWIPANSRLCTPRLPGVFQSFVGAEICV